LVAGGVAVFKSTNTLGTVGLQAIGGVFVFLGLTGIIPKRLTVGGNSVDYGDFATEVVEDALKGDDAEVQEAVARQVIETADRRGDDEEVPEDSAANRRLVRQAHGALLAQRTLSAIRASLPTGCVEVRAPTGAPGRSVIFGLPGDPPLRQVWVVVMHAPLRKAWLPNYLKSSRRAPFGANVYVGDGSDLPAVASLKPPLFAASWQDDSDTPLLRKMLEAAHKVATTGRPPAPEMFGEQRA